MHSRGRSSGFCAANPIGNLLQARRRAARLASHALRVSFAGRPRPERLTARFGRQNGVFESERPEAQQPAFLGASPHMRRATRRRSRSRSTARATAKSTPATKSCSRGVHRSTITWSSFRTQAWHQKSARHSHRWSAGPFGLASRASPLALEALHGAGCRQIRTHTAPSAPSYIDTCRQDSLAAAALHTARRTISSSARSTQCPGS